MKINRRVRRRLTLAEKIGIVTDYNSGMSLKDILERYNLKATASIYETINKMVDKETK